MLYKCRRPLAIGVLDELCVRPRHGAGSLLAPVTKQAVD